MEPGSLPSRPRAGRADSRRCPFTVDRPVMRGRWERLTFLRWPYEPTAVQHLLPGGLTVDTFGGAAWAGSSRSSCACTRRAARRAVGVELLRDQRAHLHPGPRGPGRGSGSSRSARPTSARSRWPGPATGFPTSGPRCGSSSTARRSPAPASGGCPACAPRPARYGSGSVPRSSPPSWAIATTS
jgi:Uncharacterized conserved protein (COG2071)